MGDMMAKKTKKNPQDTTLRNLRATKKRLAELELKIENRLGSIDHRITGISNLVDQLAKEVRGGSDGGTN